MEKIKQFKNFCTQIAEKVRNLSLRKALIFYMTMSLAASFFLSSLIIYAAQETQREILQSYYDSSARYMEQEGVRLGVTMEIVGLSNTMSATDIFITETLCDFLETWTTLFVPIVGCVIAMFLFYRNKIKKPLQALGAASYMIAHNQLDFTVSYTNKDELGTLCGQFELMRAELEKNNRHMWKMVEQEKALRSAIAHDIRSPLAVLKGYQEMLLEFIPEERLDKEKVLEILGAGMDQIDRLYDFVETMRRLSRLEDRKVEYMDTTLTALETKIRDTTSVMAREAGKQCMVAAGNMERQHKAALLKAGDARKAVDSTEYVSTLRVDCFMVLEVAENLISNALRFARESVGVYLHAGDDVLEICVRDDGSGFIGDAETLTKAYYHSNPQDDHVHFGLGLYLCRMYCEKHGGSLKFSNLREGGGEVKASFALGSDTSDEKRLF